jgi:hypothetical protein
MSLGMRSAWKTIINNWWVIYWIFGIILFFVPPTPTWGIIAVVIFILLVIVAVFVKKRRKDAMSRNLHGIDKINEKELARLAGVYIEDAHAFLHDVSRNPDASGIPILVKGEYIYFANEVIKNLKALYKDGKNTKEILEEMHEFETREEVKKMLEKLKEFDELPARKKEGDVGQASSASADQADGDERKGQQVKKSPLKGVHPAFGIIMALVSVMILVAASVSLNKGTVVIVTSSAPYHAWLEEIANATGYGMLSFAVALVLSVISRRKAMLVALCASIPIALSIVLYINYFRPYMDAIPSAGAEAALQAFKALVGTLEALAIGSALIGAIIEINQLRQPTR